MGSNRDFSVFVASMANVNLGLHTYGIDVISSLLRRHKWILKIQ